MGVKKGKGLIQYEDGSQYEGDFSDDKLEGVGVFQAKDETMIYEGEW